MCPFTVLLYPHTSERTHFSADVRPFTVLITIQDKVNNPSPDDPFDPEIATLLKNDKAKFLATAKEWTHKCVIHAFAVKPEKQLTYLSRHAK